MKVWLPYVRSGSGSEVYIRNLCTALAPLGIETIPRPLPHLLQYAPWLLRGHPVPSEIDLILANSWNAFAYKRTGIPLAVVEHHCVFDPAHLRFRSLAQALFHETLLRRFELESFRRADAIIAVSDYTRTSLHSALGANVTDTVLQGIDTDFYSPPPSLATVQKQPGQVGWNKRSGSTNSTDRPFKLFLNRSLSASGPSTPARLLFVGNASARKGADLLPAIMGHLGDRAELSYSSGLRDGHPLCEVPNAKPLGRLSDEHLRDAYRNADLLLFPTRLEGFGYAAAESLACGTPVVATDCSSLPEVVRHGVTGLLCPPEDTRAFADAVLRLIDDPARLQAMGKAARADAVDRFSFSRMAQGYEVIFKRLLKPS